MSESVSATPGAMSVTASATASVTSEWVSVTEAADRAGVSARTVHRWIAAGEVVSDMSEDGRRRVLTLSLPRRDTVSDSVSDKEEPVTLAETPAEPAVGDTSATLRARWEGAQTAAKIHARRAAEARQHLEEERKRHAAERGELTTELRFLREQLAAQTEAQRELRLLLAQSNQALQAATERLALPPAPERPWWRFW